LPQVSFAGSIGKTAKIPKTDALTRVKMTIVAANLRITYFNILLLLGSFLDFIFTEVAAVFTPPQPTAN
jgi:hypothetical protein